MDVKDLVLLRVFHKTRSTYRYHIIFLFENKKIKSLDYDVYVELNQ